MRVYVRKTLTPEWRRVAVRRRGSPRAWGRLLTGLALICGALCLWRWSVDLGFVAEFPFQGAGARWQTWLAASAVCGSLAWTMLGGADQDLAGRASR